MKICFPDSDYVKKDKISKLKVVKAEEFVKKINESEGRIV